MIRCEICNKEVKEAGISNHKRMAHTAEGKAQTRKANAGRRTKQSPAAWNKGLTKETDQRVMNNSVALFGHIVNASTREKLRISAKKQNLGGYIPSGGRGKKGWYKGYWCDSSWELAWIIYHLECGTIFTRNNEKFRYSYNGISKNYIPDFLLASGEYVEVKGYMTELVRAKIDQFPHNITVYDKDKMTPIIEHVVEKYGKDFIKLYEEDRSDGH